MKDNAPVVKELQVPPEQVSIFVGSGGVNLRRLRVDVGVTVSQLGEGKYQIFAPNREALTEAEERISELLSKDVSCKNNICAAFDLSAFTLHNCVFLATD